MRLAQELQQLMSDTNRAVKGNWTVPLESEIQKVLDKSHPKSESTGKVCCGEFVNTAGFRRENDGTWSIDGCCGGGCSVITDMKFCPFCGTSLL